MGHSNIVLYEEEYQQIKTILGRLNQEANARVVFLVDKNGQQIAACGEIENLDTTSRPPMAWPSSSARRNFPSCSTRANATTSTYRWWASA